MLVLGLAGVSVRTLSELDAVAGQMEELSSLFPVAGLALTLESAHAGQVLVLSNALLRMETQKQLPEQASAETEHRFLELSRTFEEACARMLVFAAGNAGNAETGSRGDEETRQALKRNGVIQEICGSIDRAATSFLLEARMFLGAVRAGRIEEARRFHASASRAAPHVSAALARVVPFLKETMGEEDDDARAFESSARWVVYAAAIAAVAAALLGAVGFARSLVGPLRRITKDICSIAEQLAGTQFEHRPLDVTTRDEVGQLATGVNAVSERFVAALLERDLALEELTKSRDQAVEGVRVKTQFLANMSHEIRTPLNGVIGMTGLMLETPLDPEQREFAETIRASGETLLTLVNDILDLSKVEAGRIELECVDFSVRSLVEETLDLVVETAERKGLEIGCLVEDDVDAAVRGDPGRLRQVLTNLIGNAVKFTPRGEVFVHVGVAERTEPGVRLRFEVKDTGIGMTPDQHARIFQPFVQADASTTRKYGGTGLGLAISRRIVELMGGTLDVETEQGAGSTFWFTILLRRGQAVTPPSLSAARLRGHRVLVVDDNETNRRILRGQLRAWAMDVEVAENGRQALELLAASAMAGQPFSVAILDYLMPEMDGLDLARRIKADPVLAPTRLGLLTSVKWHGDMAEAQAAGIDVRLTKPVRRSRLFDAVCHLLRDSLDPVSPPRSTDDPGPPSATLVGGLRVLVAEDNAVNQKVALHMLARLECRADLVGDGTEAVEAVRGTHYDVILMDVQMPTMDGYEATRNIRKLEGDTPRTVIIGMTANAMEGDREKCRLAGMDDYLAKPVAFDTLRQALVKWAASVPVRCES